MKKFLAIFLTAIATIGQVSATTQWRTCYLGGYKPEPHESELYITPGKTLDTNSFFNESAPEGASELNTRFIITRPLVMMGAPEKVAVLKSQSFLKFSGSLELSNNKILRILMVDNATVTVNNSLVFSNVATKLSNRNRLNPFEDVVCDYPKISVAKALRLENTVKFYVNNRFVVTVGKYLNVSELTNFSLSTENIDDCLIFRGATSDKEATLYYHNPEDTNGLRKIEMIKTLPSFTRRVCIEVVRERLRKLFVGANCLFKTDSGVEFQNMKIHNYHFPESLFDYEIIEALKKFKITIVNVNNATLEKATNKIKGTVKKK